MNTSCVSGGSLETAALSNYGSQAVRERSKVQAESVSLSCDSLARIRGVTVETLTLDPYSSRVSHV